MHICLHTQAKHFETWTNICTWHCYSFNLFTFQKAFLFVINSYYCFFSWNSPIEYLIIQHRQRSDYPRPTTNLNQGKGLLLICFTTQPFLFSAPPPPLIISSSFSTFFFFFCLTFLCLIFFLTLSIICENTYDALWKFLKTNKMKGSFEEGTMFGLTVDFVLPSAGVMRRLWKDLVTLGRTGLCPAWQQSQEFWLFCPLAPGPVWKRLSCSGHSLPDGNMRSCSGHSLPDGNMTSCSGHSLPDGNMTSCSDHSLPDWNMSSCSGHSLPDWPQLTRCLLCFCVSLISVFDVWFPILSLLICACVALVSFFSVLFPDLRVLICTRVAECFSSAGQWSMTS